MDQLGPFITNHWQLCLAFIGILSLVGINEFITQSKKAKELTPQAAVDLINHENALVIDLRDQEAFNTGHIIDSIQAKEEDFSLPKMNKYKNKPIILVCARGLQAATTAAKLRTQGFQPQVLGGGIAAWNEAELPLIKSKG
ncbi:MAG: rhodanese-like domain-containing protein [Legionellales bacterium]